MEQLGRCLRQIRRAKDLTQRDLAALSGINYVTISRLERGDYTQVYVETLIRLADALGVSTDALLGREKPESDLEPTGLATVGASY